jgi:hypothetical protein
MTLLTVNTRYYYVDGPPVDPGPGGGDSAVPPISAVSTSTGRFTQLTFADPLAPTEAELVRLIRERWHTRPNWMYTGETPKNLVQHANQLPGGYTYDAGANTLNVNGAVEALDGWDFGLTQTRVILGTGDDVEAITNCRFSPPVVQKSDRLSISIGSNGPIGFSAYNTGRLRLLRKCIFTAGPGHEGGPWAPQANITAFPEGGAVPTLDVMEFCSFEAMGQDAIKGAWRGTFRYNYFDCSWNVPDDATQWQSGVTYNRGDVVYNAPPTRQDWLKICLRDGVTSAPNWSSATSTTSDWGALDPHFDIDQSPDSPSDFTNPYYGNIYVCDQTMRRFPSRKHQTGVTNAMRFIPNGSTGQQGSRHIHHNIFTDEVEIEYITPPTIQLSTSNLHPGTQITVEDNWYQTQQLVTATGSHITVQNNISGWTKPEPATLSNISALHGRNTDTIAYEFTASLGGWATVVVTSSSTLMTAKEIIDAHREGTALTSFEIDAEEGVIALGFGALSLTTGQTVYAHMLYQAGGGADTIASVQTVTEGAGTVSTFTLTEMDFDGYVFDRNGGDHCPVILTGTGRAGDQIQCWGTSAGGDTTVESTVVRSNGTWSITMLVPEAQWGNWYAPRARLGDSGTVLSGTNTFGCGDVLMILGQSELHYILDNDSYFNSNLTRSIDAENLTVILHDEDDVPSPVTTARITSGTVTSANAGSLALANAFNYILPDRKLMIVDAAHSGTSPFQLWNDASTGRQWSEMMDMVNKARASGSEIGGVIMNWYNAPAASIDQMLNDWAPGMFGQLANGTTFTLGTNHSTASESNFRADIDHCFWDADAETSEAGRGIFTRDRTKLHLMLPMPFNDVADATAQPAFPTNQRMVNAERAGILTFAADSRVQTFLADVGPGTHLADFDEQNTGTSLGIHPNVASPLGIPWFANQHLPAVLRQAGQTVSEPLITGTEVINANTVDVIVSLPNGGNLTTLAALLSISNPSPRPDHHHDVVGFQISRSGDKRAIRRIGTGYSSAWTGTITIQDTGTGTGESRTGRVRIVLANNIQTGDILTYLDGQANANLQGSDEAAKLFRWMLLETVPAWRNDLANYPFYGIPVRPQTPMAALTAP